MYLKKKNLIFLQKTAQKNHLLPSQRDGSFEHPKHMFKLIGKKIITFLGKSFASSGPMKTTKFV